MSPSRSKTDTDNKGHASSERYELQDDSKKANVSDPVASDSMGRIEQAAPPSQCTSNIEESSIATTAVENGTVRSKWDDDDSGHVKSPQTNEKDAVASES